MEIHRDLQVEGLLDRDVVRPDYRLMAACITGKSVMVTGAGGSIGAELCRQIIRLKPLYLILFERSEIALYHIENELGELANTLKGCECVNIAPVLGSVQNRGQVENAIRQYGVNTVYHAAAYKQVPMLERNTIAGVQNNVFGTLMMARTAEKYGVENFVFISTDKAVRPTNIMGATKRFSEQVLQAMTAKGGRTRFSMVRFGNVLGSSGSVVPLFRKQILNGGPVTVTHPDVSRYFMTAQEASQLVIQAGGMARGGEVFVLDMDEPVKILDIAKKMIRMMGYEVRSELSDGEGIPIEITGLRQGEKLSEELWIGETLFETDHPRIMRAVEDHLDWPQLSTLLARLEDGCNRLDQKLVRETLSEANGGFGSIEILPEPVLDIPALPPIREPLPEEEGVQVEMPVLRH